ALGKIGLPLAVQIASKGHEVIGADVSAEVVGLVNSAIPPFPGEAHLDELLGEVVLQGLLNATTNTTEAVSVSEVVVVVVPLMTDSEGVPNFSAIDSATSDIAAGLQHGTLVSYETTLPVGTTRNRFGTMIEEKSGLRLGSDFDLIHSPERVFSGRIFADLRRYPKLVGGVDEKSTKRGVEFYEAILDFDERPDLQKSNGVWPMASVEAAEMAKLAETTYRDVNIALANEFAAFAEVSGIDVGEVITASNSQPFSHIHRPGVAVGGHCIPVYPRFYLSGHPGARLVETAREVNLSVPDRVVSSVADRLGDLAGASVLILGAAYRGGVKETAYSGVFDLVESVRARGGSAVVEDPLYENEELVALGLEPWDGEDVDAVIVQADHREYTKLTPADLPGAKVIFDGRGVLDGSQWAQSGVMFDVIGQGKTAS
ncbi:MAG: nucleotide sugar dehydrogenase, partial [Actinobacteria bacterium]|nr:nucleotide sugar dehydrogenase [Actinomycetota bacterium]